MVRLPGISRYPFGSVLRTQFHAYWSHLLRYSLLWWANHVISSYPHTQLPPHAGLSGSLAGAPVIKLNEIGQVFATPSARSHSSFASTIDAVQVANLENSLLRVVRYFPYSQGEGMKVKKQMPVAQ
jgi:hypothetical protein